MNWSKSMLILVISAVILTSGIDSITDISEGEVTDDFDLLLDRTLVNIIRENGYLNRFTVELINQCAHSLSIELTCAGLQVVVSPQVFTVTLAPYASQSVYITAAMHRDEAPGIYQVTIHALVVRVDGLAVDSGKERHGSVIVQKQRDHVFSIRSSLLSAARGEATYENVLVKNEGNSVEYVTLEFDDHPEITGYPAVDYLMIPVGGIVEYPVILTVSEKSSRGFRSVECTVRSLMDKDIEMNQTMSIEVTDEIRNEHAGPSGNGGGSFIVLTFAMAMVLAMASLLLHKASSQGSANAFNRSISFLLVLALLLSSAPTLTSPNVSAQIAPDVTIIVSNPSMILDPSPLTGDDAAAGTSTITIQSGAAYEMVVEIDINNPLMVGYVREVRVPAGGSGGTTISVGIEKEAPYQVINAAITMRVIEINGIPVEGSGYQQSTGFMVQVRPYSLPHLSVTSTPGQVKRNVVNVVGFRVMNLGNAVETFELKVKDQAQWEDQGFAFSNISLNEDLDIGEERNMILEITPEEKLTQEFTPLRILATGNVDRGSTWGCTVVLKNRESEDEDDEEGWETMAAGSGAVILVFVILVFFIRKKRTDTGGPAGDDWNEDEYTLE